VVSFLICAAATAVDTIQQGSSDWISGSTLVTILTIICGGGGLAIGRQAGIKRGREEEAAKHRIEGKVDANVPQPLSTEQTAYQAHCKDNAKDHENLFGRLSHLEQKVASIDAKLDATIASIQRQLDTLTDMVSQLFSRICKKK